jgi:hypothetical protein
MEEWLPTKIVEFEKIEVLPGGRKHRHRLLLWKIQEPSRSQ